MLDTLEPWAKGPFELLVHAELHKIDGEDFDRRIALIGFDNAIEVAITTYLDLHPAQRGGVEFEGKHVAAWIKDYHTKLDFLEAEMERRGKDMVVDKAHLIWYHKQRNGLYHSGSPLIPTESDIDGVRKAALWVYSELFEVDNPEDLLIARRLELVESKGPEREDAIDKLIDEEYGVITFGDAKFYASEILHSHDAQFYKDLGKELKALQSRELIDIDDIEAFRDEH